jgi:hypothetical protein
MPASPSSLIASLSAAPTGLCPPEWTVGLPAALAAVPDPRARRGIRLAHQAKPTHLANWIRGHWSIENKVHWVRDVTYDEDRSQIRTGTGPQVMAAIRNAAIGALRLGGATNIAAASRHHARNPNRPLTLLGIA